MWPFRSGGEVRCFVWGSRLDDSDRVAPRSDLEESEPIGAELLERLRVLGYAK